MEISLVLSGGGARGIFHLGVIKALIQKGFKIKAISGSSIGSVIASLIASGNEPEKIFELAKKPKFKEIFKFSYLKNGLFGGFYKFNENAEILKDFKIVDKIENMKMQIFITCLDLKTSKRVVFSSGDTLKICFGSCAIMPIFTPVIYNDFILSDGGFVNNFPISPLLELPYKIVGIDLHAQNESSEISLKKAIRASMSSQSEVLASKCDLLIATPKLNKFKIFSLKNFDEMYELGYQTALNLNFEKLL